jgi:hypothetical protein
MSMLDVSLADESGLDYDEYMSDDLESLTEEDFENEDEFEDEEDEESCGSSCSFKPKKVSLVSLQGLKSHFDQVMLERMEDFNLLTLRDKANKSNYDWIIWLQVKIPFGDHNTCSIRTDEEYIEGVCKEILTWVDLLKNFEKKSEPKQLSLFGEELGDDELEIEPESPTSGEDRSWSKYWRERERVRVSNLKKKYSFFELVDFHSSWLVYHEPYVVQSWIRQLPQNNLEMIELVKDAIIKGTSGDYDNRNDEFWWDDDTNYMKRDGALSDYDLIARVKQLIRLYLVPYTEYFSVSTDLSYSAWDRKEQTSYRFWFDGRKLNGCSWLRNDELPTYDLYDSDFILWLRNHFDIPHKEVISDDDILRENIKGLFGRVFKDDFDAMKEIELAKDFNQFKARANAHVKLGNDGGSSYSIDGFRARFNLYGGKNGDVITIEQSIQQRLELNRPVEGLKESNYGLYVWKLNFAQALEQAYRLFKKETKKQTTLFDFLVA